MDDPPFFGHTLRDRRKARDLTQEALAEQVSCSIETIRKIEAGKLRPSRPLAALLTDALAIPMEEREAFLKAARATAEPLQPVLPQGTLTFLFTDIEGSTQLWEQHPDMMPAALTRHDALVRESIEAHGGVVFKTVGDSAHAVFASAPAALAAALAAQRALTTEPWGALGSVRVRMALHMGIAEERNGDYFGPPLNRVARLLAAGHGGQMLLSGATQELVADSLPSGVILRDLGAQRLKDLTRPEHIFQVVAPDLPDTFPPLRTLTACNTNLPSQPTPFIGRERDLAAVREHLRQSGVRLLTLTGAPGIGKTRLALQVAVELLDDFSDGVWLVSLAPITDPALVASTIAQTLGIKELGSQPLLDQLKIYLHAKQLLLVLDNFEQVLDAATEVAALLAGASGLKVLVTSRAALHLSAEHIFPVPPLGLPDPQHLPPLEDLTKYDAVRLFMARAQATKSAFIITRANASAVAEICFRLDGLPLAIELVVARLKLFSPETLVHRLRQPLQLLTGGSRDLPARQQTLGAAIDWSYHLLDAGEQTLFQRLAVFVGSWTLEAAQAICDLPGDQSLDFLDIITALVDKSLLQQTQTPAGESRLTMLETIREYAWKRLNASGAAEVIRQQHATYYLAFVEASEPELEGAQQSAWLQQLASEHDNLRAAFAWICATPGTVEMSLRFTGALYGFWRRRRYLSETRAWLEAALARPGGPPAARTKALFSLAQIADHLQEYARAMTLYSESLTIFQELDDRIGVARALLNQGRVLYFQGDYERAGMSVEQSLTHFQALGDRAGVSMALLSLGDLALLQGDFERARASFEEGKLISQELGLTARAAGATLNLGRTAHAAGDDILASRLLAESLALFRAVGDQSYAGSLVLGVARSMHRQGDNWHTTTLYRESLTLLRELGTQAEISECLAGLAQAAGSQGQPVRATRLFGAAEGLRARIGALWQPIERAAYEASVASVRAQLDQEIFAVAWAEGRTMTLEQAITYALGEDTQDVRS